MPATIVAPQTMAAEEGLEVLRRGGNAVDAAVTCALVQSVVDPQMCGLGGGGVMLVRPAGAVPVAIEFWPRVGSQATEDQWADLFVREAADRYGYVLEGAVNDVGYESVAVPGTVAGLAEALERFGTISWDQAVRPAVPYAREGFAVTGFMHSFWVGDSGPDAVPAPQRIQATDEARRLYTKDGQLYRVGETMVQADLARTLERLASAGPDDFYRGSIAEEIAADFEAHGGRITEKDLAGYRAEITEPVRGTYRGRTVLAAGPPAGGMTLLQMLNVLEGFDLAAAGWPSAEAARARVEAMAWAMAERELYLADPRFTPVPVDRLTSKQHAAEALAELAAGGRFVGRSVPSTPDTPHTTHVSVVDDAGTAVSLTHTLGLSSGVVTPGLGFGFNNYMNCFDPRPGRVGSIAPGKTRVTMMTPTLVFNGDGEGEGHGQGDGLELVLGAPGATRIVTGVLQTLVNLVDHGMTPVEAVSAPRVDCQGDVVQAEGRMPRDVLRALRDQGYEVNQRTMNYDTYFARVQAVAIGRGGAADPRGDGGVALTV